MLGKGAGGVGESKIEPRTIYVPLRQLYYKGQVR